jgi:hypothetical protein
VREGFNGDASRRRKAVDQRKPIEAFLEAPRKIISPALTAEVAPFPYLLHVHAQDQHLVDQHSAVGPEFVLDAVEPHHRPTLTFRDRLPHLAAVDAFTGRIDRPRAALGLLPIILECPAASELRLVDLPA